MNTREKINRIIEITSFYDEQELKNMTDEEIDEILDELCDNSDMFPNGRDYDAEDED